MLRQFARFLLLLILTSSMRPAIVSAQSRKTLDSLLEQLPARKADTAQVRLLNTIGFRYCSFSPDTGIIYARRALALSEKIGYERGVAYAYNNLGSCAVYQADFPRATEQYSRSFQRFEALNDTAGMLKAIGNLGAVAIYRSDYPRALDLNLRALKYAEAIRDTPSITINLGNIGAIYEYMDEYDKGLKYNFRALEILNHRHDSVSIAVTLGNIGNLYIGKKAFAEALRYQQQAMGIHERLGMEGDASRDLMNVGSIYEEQQDYVQALRSYFTVLGRLNAQEFLPLRATTLNGIGIVLLKLAKDKRRRQLVNTLTIKERTSWKIVDDSLRLAAMAVPYLEESIRIDSAAENINGLQEHYLALSGAQRMTGRFADALRSQDQYMRFKDSVFSIENRTQMANLETRREAELKDKQIELDRLAVKKKRNERVFFIAGFVLLLIVAGIVIRNIRLRNSKELSENKLSAFQARMNPHFIFNSLNSIQSLVLSGETISSITYLSRFSKLMRQILDGSARSKTLLQEEIDMLRSYIELEQLRFDRFEFTIDIEPGINPEALEVPTMIIQPFVENAIIHGLLPRREGGILKISFLRNGNTIICEVDDNGIGRRKSAELNAARSKEHRSQGIGIATNRLSILGKRKPESAVQYLDKEDAGIPAGTTVVLQIPIL